MIQRDNERIAEGEGENSRRRRGSSNINRVTRLETGERKSIARLDVLGEREGSAERLIRVVAPGAGETGSRRSHGKLVYRKSGFEQQRMDAFQALLI